MGTEYSFSKTRIFVFKDNTDGDIRFQRQEYSFSKTTRCLVWKCRQILPFQYHTGFIHLHKRII